MIFSPVRDKGVVMAELNEAVLEYRNRPDDTNKGALYRKARALMDEYRCDVLDTYETDTFGVRLAQVDDRYFVTTYEIHELNGVRSSMTGYLFFGGTTDEQAARDAYERKVNGDISQDSDAV